MNYRKGRFRKEQIKMEVKIRKWGNSQGILLPMKVLNAVGIDKENDRLNLEIGDNQKIVLEKIEKKEKPLTIKDVIKGFDSESYWAEWEKEHPNQSKEVSFGKPVGKEIF